jgi:hypothetical protein
MSELLGWMILVGLTVGVVGICMLSYQIEKQTRVILEFLLRSNEMILAHLEPSAEAPAVTGTPAPPVERRRAQRRNPLTRLLDVTCGERRMYPLRRLEDLLQS